MGDINDLMAIFRSACKELHSTETGLVKAQNDILMAIDGKQSVFLILLDLSVAFDTLDHQHLTTFLQVANWHGWYYYEMVHLIPDQSHSAS